MVSEFSRFCSLIFDEIMVIWHCMLLHKYTEFNLATWLIMLILHRFKCLGFQFLIQFLSLTGLKMSESDFVISDISAVGWPVEW